MTGLRLTSVLLAVLASAGAWATPVRAVESTRLRTSIVRCTEDPAARQARHALLHTVAGTPTPPPVLGTAISHPPCPLPLPHALYRRPPPTS